MAVPPVGQMFQIGNLPLLNTLLYRNSPAQLAQERIFQALSGSTDVPSDLGLVDPSIIGLIWDEVSALDWLPAPSRFPEVRKELCPFAETPEQQAFDHQEGSHIAVMDKAFADLASEGDDFGDLGDY